MLRIFLALFEWKAASVAFGTLVIRLSALFAASLVNVPQPARFLVSAGAVASPVMWPGSVRRLEGPSVSLFRPASDGSSDESDHSMEQSPPSPSIVVSVPVSAQSTPSSVPNESGHVMEEFPRSSPKAPAVSAPVSVPVTVFTAPATVAVSASPVTVPVSGIVSVAPVTVTGSVFPAIVNAPAPACYS